MISQALSKILSNRKIADGHFRLRLGRPKSIRSIRPGQFLQVQVNQKSDPFLPRPLCVYDYGKGWMEVVYQVAGQGTRILTEAGKGDAIGVVGPLGNGFAMQADARTSVFVAGGVGIASLYLTAKELVRKGPKRGRRFVLLFGSQTRKMLHCHTDFRRLGFEVHIATDDGTAGKKGYVTALVPPLAPRVPAVVYEVLWSFLSALPAPGPPGSSLQLACNHGLAPV